MLSLEGYRLHSDALILSLACYHSLIINIEYTACPVTSFQTLLYLQYLLILNIRIRPHLLHTPFVLLVAYFLVCTGLMGGLETQQKRLVCHVAHLDHHICF